MENPPSTKPDFDLEVKACAEALQSAQKRTRTAFFLCISAACIVGLMVFNLFQSKQFRNNEQIKKASSQSDDLKEYTKHIEDSSFYQVPALAIQITCDDVGILGPLALFVLSLYSLMAFKACDYHVKCAGQFARYDLISTLFETERVPEPRQLFLVLQSFLLFLPSLACIAVGWYAISAHFRAPLLTDPLYEIILASRATAQTLDLIGAAFAFLVLLFNFQAISFFRSTHRRVEAHFRTTPEAPLLRKAGSPGA